MGSLLNHLTAAWENRLLSSIEVQRRAFALEYGTGVTEVRSSTMVTWGLPSFLVEAVGPCAAKESLHQIKYLSPFQSLHINVGSERDVCDYDSWKQG